LIQSCTTIASGMLGLTTSSERHWSASQQAAAARRHGHPGSNHPSFCLHSLGDISCHRRINGAAHMHARLVVGSQGWWCWHRMAEAQRRLKWQSDMCLCLCFCSSALGSRSEMYGCAHGEEEPHFHSCSHTEVQRQS
jgi:hypothetical protein